MHRDIEETKSGDDDDGEEDDDDDDDEDAGEGNQEDLMCLASPYVVFERYMFFLCV